MSFNNGPANTKPDTATAPAFKTQTTPVPAALVGRHAKHKGHANGPANGPAPAVRSPNPSLSDHSHG